MRKKYLLFAAILISSATFAQDKFDKGVFREYRPGFYQNSILKDNRDVEEQQEPVEKPKIFKMDFSGMNLPNKVSFYSNPFWHNPPISQGNTGTCWCFSTTSFYESEIYRLTKQKVKLSEMYTVYWEYVEKARRFIEERGNSVFDEGSECNALARIWKQYGIVPEADFNGLPEGRKFYNHEKLANEMKAYLNSLKTSNAWDEDEALATIKSILNHYIGVPPTSVKVNGKNYTPQQYLKEVLKLNLDDYVDILSLEQEPFYKQVEYKVPDNWWHNKEYYNVPLKDFMAALKSAIRHGYSMAIGGDVSEAGFDRDTQAAIIPSFDIPSDYINDDARQFRFSNQTTTDDHGMHLVGYTEKDGKDWYLIKDSSAGSRNNDSSKPEFGYYFFHEDFVKLKMINFTVHKDAVKDLLKKFK